MSVAGRHERKKMLRAVSCFESFFSHSRRSPFKQHSWPPSQVVGTVAAVWRVRLPPWRPVRLPLWREGRSAEAIGGGSVAEWLRLGIGGRCRRHRWRKARAAGVHAANALEQVLPRGIFQQVALRASGDGARHIMIGIERRQHDDASRASTAQIPIMAPKPSRPGIRKSINVTSGR